MTTAAALAASFPKLSAAMCEWLATGNNDDFADAYCENYKDAHGIKARWVLGREYSREEWASMFNSLEHALDAEFAREEAENAAFAARLASVGLTEWAERNGIRTEYDLMEHNYRNGN